MKAMILAAGYGTRLRPLTDHIPKPLLTVAGKPLIVHHLHALRDAGITDLVINVAHLGQMIIDYLQDGKEFGVNITYSKEAQPLETAGGIQHALPLLGAGPFLLVNGDIYTDYPFVELLQRYQAGFTNEQIKAHLVLVANQPPHIQGDFALQQDQVVAKDAASPALTFAGISVFKPEVFQGRNQLSKLRPILDELLAGQSLVGEYYQGKWYDVGTVERLEELAGECSKRQQ